MTPRVLARLLLIASVLASGLVLTPAASAADAVVISFVAPDRAAAGTRVRMLLEEAGLNGYQVISSPQGDLSFTHPSLSGVLWTVDVVVAASPAFVGPHDLVVTDTRDGTTSTCTGCFSIGAPAPSPVVTVVPSDGRLDLSIAAPDGVPAPDGYRITWSSVRESQQSREVSGGIATIDGLENGISYSFAVASLSSEGVSLPKLFFARPGTVPSKPTLTATPFLDGFRIDSTVASTYGYRTTHAFTVNGPDGSSYTTSQYDAFNVVSTANVPRGRWTVTDVATNQFGRSVPSDPISATPWGLAGPPRNVQIAYANGVETFRWSPPANNGGTPVTGYEAWIRLNGQPLAVRRLTAPYYFLNIRPGTSVSIEVFAVTAAGRSLDAGGRYGSATLVASVGLDASHRAVYRETLRGSWRALGGPTFVSTPSVAKALSGRVLIAASDASGQAWVRSLTTGWQPLTRSYCGSVAISFQLGWDELHIGCRTRSGLFATGWADAIRGVPSSVGIDVSNTSYVVMGGIDSVNGEFAFRTRPFDAQGHNVVVHSPFGPTRRMALACTSDVGFGSGAELDLLLACLDGARRVQWYSGFLSFATGNHGESRGVIASTGSLVGKLGAVTAIGEGRRVTAVGNDGLLRELDVPQRTWRTITGARLLPGTTGGLLAG